VKDSTRYRVADRGGIVIGHSIVQDRVLSADEVKILKGKKTRSGYSVLEDHVKSGHLIPLDSGQHSDPGRSDSMPGVHTETSPGVDLNDPSAPDEPTPDSLIVKTGDGSVKTSATQPPRSAGKQQATANERWSYSDEALAGKDLDGLNVLILENLRDDEKKGFETFETEEEARAFLQQDAKKKKS